MEVPPLGSSTLGTQKEKRWVKVSNDNTHKQKHATSLRGPTQKKWRDRNRQPTTMPFFWEKQIDKVDIEYTKYHI